MAIIPNVNFNNMAQDFEDIPLEKEGDFDVKVTYAMYKSNDSYASSYISLKLAVQNEGEDLGKVIWQNLYVWSDKEKVQSYAIRDLTYYMKAVGMSQKEQLDTDRLVGGIVAIKTKEYESPNDGSIRYRVNSVSKSDMANAVQPQQAKNSAPQQPQAQPTQSRTTQRTTAQKSKYSMREPQVETFADGKDPWSIN